MAAMIAQFDEEASAGPNNNGFEKGFHFISYCGVFGIGFMLAERVACRCDRRFWR